MIVRGTFIAFIGDWLHATKLCIRIPSQGVLLISEPIANPMVPQFDNFAEYGIDLEVQRQLILDGVIEKLNAGDHPFATPTETHLLDVMGGATLIALRLACKGSGLKYPDDVFQDIPYEELPATVHEMQKSWKDACIRHTVKKTYAIKALKELKASKVSAIPGGGSSSDDPDPSMDEGEYLTLSSISFSIISFNRSGKWWE